MQNDIKKSCRFKLVLSLVLSVFLVGGIVSIIFGATSSTALLVIGIIMTVLGFYGSPISWVSYGNLVVEKAVLYAITEDHIESITAISQNLGISENDAKAKVNHLMSNRYLTGYKLQEDGTLVAIEKPKEKKQEENLLKLKKCPNCGANLTETADHKYKCKYCGVTFDK